MERVDLKNRPACRSQRNTFIDPTLMTFCRLSFPLLATPLFVTIANSVELKESDYRPHRAYVRCSRAAITETMATPAPNVSPKKIKNCGTRSTVRTQKPITVSAEITRCPRHRDCQYACLPVEGVGTSEHAFWTIDQNTYASDLLFSPRPAQNSLNVTRLEVPVFT